MVKENNRIIEYELHKTREQSARVASRNLKGKGKNKIALHRQKQIDTVSVYQKTWRNFRKTCKQN